MDKDEALKLALEALNTPRPTDSYPPLWRSYEKTINDAITALKQALAADVREPVATLFGSLPVYETPPVKEPVAWKWHQAPVKTSWGNDMVVADLAIDKDNTVSVYCERDQTVKVEAMFNSPAAQRQWVGLDAEDRWEIIYATERDERTTVMELVEAKLKEKNT